MSLDATGIASARSELTAICRALRGRRLTGPLSSGNASLRIGEHLLVTPSAVAFEQTTPERLVLVELRSGEPVQPDPGVAVRDATEAAVSLPTSELVLHLRAHAVAAPTARVVLHLHAPWMVAASCLDLDELPLLHYHQALLGDAPTPVAPYATPGSVTLAEQLGRVLRPATRAALLANHGGVVLGASPEEALSLAELLEDVCRLVVLTHPAPRELSPGDLVDARRLFETYGRP